MCYEYSGWFDKLRAKQLRKAQQDIKPTSKEPVCVSANEVTKEPVTTTKPAETREKIPA